MLGAFAFVLLCTMGCGQQESAADPSPTQEQQAATSPAPVRVLPADLDAASLQQAGLFVAGQQPTSGTATRWQAHPAWQEHASAMDSAWNKLQQDYLQPIHSWVQAEPERVPNPDLPLFYPFGGPDLLHALAFFPQTRHVVSVGLEPTGSISDPSTVVLDHLDGDLAALRSVLENLVQSGYFVSKHMREGLDEESPSGIANVLLLQVQRLGFVPQRVRYLEIDADGSVREVELPENGAPQGLRIAFRWVGEDSKPASDEDDGAGEHLVDFFSQDLSNAGLSAMPGFGSMIRAMAPFNTYMKCTHYLPHTPGFSEFVDLVQESSQVILMDDSGPLLSAFDRDRWSLRFYGTYSQTLPVYQEYFQPDLAKVYAEAGDTGQPIPALPFAIGYHVEIGSCLLLAERKSEGT